MAYFNIKEARYYPTPIPEEPPYNPPPIPENEDGSIPEIPRPDFTSDTNIILYKCADDSGVMYKTLTNQYVMTGTFKEDTDMIEPYIIIETDTDLTQYNYAYISLFNRYYFLSVELISGRRYRLKMMVDVLMSVKDELINVPCIIDKEFPHNDLYINDGTYVQGNKNYTNVINYSNGFMSSPENILICCGGV